jgi:hypothetical protein
MTNRLLFLVLVGCGPIAPLPAPPPPPPDRGTVVDFEVHGPLPPAPSGGAEPTEPRVAIDQPAHVKLKLGHFRNHRLGIGVTIDLLSAATENVADIDPAKVRFDGESQVWLLEGRHGGSDRIDYVRDNGRLLLSVSRTGRYTVYVPDPETDHTSEGIDVTRDGDAHPL